MNKQQRKNLRKLMRSQKAKSNQTLKPKTRTDIIEQMIEDEEDLSYYKTLASEHAIEHYGIERW